MFDARPTTIKTAESPLFNAVGRIGDAGALIATAGRWGAKGFRALSLFYLAFVFAIGALADLVTASSLAHGLVVAVLGCVVVGGLGYAGYRMLS